MNRIIYRNYLPSSNAPLINIGSLPSGNDPNYSNIQNALGEINSINTCSPQTALSANIAPASLPLQLVYLLIIIYPIIIL